MLSEQIDFDQVHNNQTKEMLNRQIDGQKKELDRKYNELSQKETEILLLTDKNNELRQQVRTHMDKVLDVQLQLNNKVSENIQATLNRICSPVTTKPLFTEVVGRGQDSRNRINSATVQNTTNTGNEVKEDQTNTKAMIVKKMNDKNVTRSKSIQNTRNDATKTEEIQRREGNRENGTKDKKNVLLLGCSALKHFDAKVFASSWKTLVKKAYTIEEAEKIITGCAANEADCIVYQLVTNDVKVHSPGVVCQKMTSLIEETKKKMPKVKIVL